MKNSFGSGNDGTGGTPTTDEDGGAEPTSPTGTDETYNPDSPDGQEVEGNRKELTEEEKQRSPLRNKEGEAGAGETKDGSKETPKETPKGAPKGKGVPNPVKPKGKFGKLASIAGKGAGAYYQVARIATTATMSAIGMTNLANKTNQGFNTVGRKFSNPQSPIRKAIGQGADKVKGFVDKRRANKPNPTDNGTKIPTTGEKPMTPKREGKMKPTIVSQERPSQTSVIKDDSSSTGTNITRKEGMKPIKKPVRFPKKKKKRK